jgi:hypothetical protein
MNGPPLSLVIVVADVEGKSVGDGGITGDAVVSEEVGVWGCHLELTRRQRYVRTDEMVHGVAYDRGEGHPEGQAPVGAESGGGQNTGAERDGGKPGAHDQVGTGEGAVGRRRSRK